MNGTMKQLARRNWAWVRYVAWAGAAGLVLLPLVAMQVAPDSGVNWTFGDFVFAVLMIGGTGLAIELVVRLARSWAARAGAVVALGTGFLLIWSNLAVGYIGSEDNPYNLLFFGVIVVAVLGSALARFRSPGLVWAMAATALAHAAAGLGGFAEDPVTGPITLAFCLMWLTSAALFRAAR